MAKRVKPEPMEDDGEARLHPRATPCLFGHEKAKREFLQAYVSGALHHGWLVTGERGIGKATFAYRAARFLLAQPGDDVHTPTDLNIAPESPVFRQIAARGHPSLFVLESGGGSIAVDDVRKLRSFTGLTSVSSWRAVIVDDANSLTIGAANALLKALEEPPPRTLFFLVAQGAAAVMPTIRSRCIRLPLQPLGSSGLESAVLAFCGRSNLAAPDAATLEAVCAAANGSVARAIVLLGMEPAAGAKLDTLLSKLPDLDWTLAHDIVRLCQGAKNAAAFTLACDTIEQRVEDTAKNLAQSGSQLRAADEWAKLWAWFREERTGVETLNLDKGAFLMAAFSGMERAARETPPQPSSPSR